MKIYLKGFFFKNLGDDLFVHMIAKRYPQHQFLAVTNQGFEDQLSMEPNVKVIGLNKIARGINKLFNLYDLIEKKAELSVVISGSIFQEFSEDTEALKRLQSLPGKKNPTYILGVNFGPYETETYYQAARNYFKSIKDVCFRDQWSRDLFADIAQVRYAPDILLGIENIIAGSSEKKANCVISVMDFERKEYLKPFAEQYEQFIVSAMQYYVSNGYGVTLISFCKIEGDEKAIEKILARCSDEIKEKTRVEKYDGQNWKEIIETISQASYLIATRFHSMILGSVFQIPTLPIVYNDKCRHFLADIGCEQYGIFLEQLEHCEMKNIEYMQVDHLDKLKSQAEEQFKALDLILGK